MSTTETVRGMSHLPGAYQGPIPVKEPETAFYWEGLVARELRILRCQHCRRLVHYPLACCPSCQSFELVPEALSGDGFLYSFTDVHVRFVDGIEPPYVVGLVELVEQSGLRVLTNIVDVDINEITIGMKLRPLFVDIAPGSTLLYFTKRSEDE
jgi:uncharacterized protein